MFRRFGFLAPVFVLALGILFYFWSPRCGPNPDGYGEIPAVQANHTGEYAIFIDVETSKLHLFHNGELEKTYPCAGGTFQTPSPIGTWTIISKGTWGEGFGGRWMGLDCPWGKFGIHGTIYPDSIGWNSSHGCIRMYNKDVKELYGIVPHGTKVTIVDGPYGDFGRGFRNIGPGMYGADVMQIQKRLKELGYFNGYCNGHYDVPGFQTAIQKFQKKNGLGIGNTIYKDFYEKLGFVQME